MRTFPTLGSEHYEWFSLGWEPIAASGERICAFVVVSNAANPSDNVIHRCISQRQLRCMLGEAAEQAQALVDFADAAIHEYMRLPNRAVASPGIFRGFAVLQSGNLYANSILAASHAAVRQASLLGSSAMTEFSDAVIAAVEEQVAVAEQQTEDRFYQLVHREVIEKLPSLEPMFRRSFRLTDTARPTRIDFAGHHLIVNLHRIRPGRTLTQQIRYGKQKLLDLSSLRLWLAEQPISEQPTQQFELIAHRPIEDSVEHTDGEIRQVAEAVEELTYAADHHQLRLRVVTEASAAANRILDSESA